MVVWNLRPHKNDWDWQPAGRGSSKATGRERNSRPVALSAHFLLNLRRIGQPSILVSSAAQKNVTAPGLSRVILPWLSHQVFRVVSGSCFRYLKVVSRGGVFMKM